MIALVGFVVALGVMIREHGLNDVVVNGRQSASINTGDDVESVDRALAALVACGASVIASVRDTGNDTNEWRVAAVAIDGFEIHLHGGHRRRRS